MSAKRLRKLVDRYRVTSGKGFRLKDHDPADTGGPLLDHAESEALLADGVRRLAALQELLYPQDQWALLCAFQAMDAAGKDGTIKHVMSGVNPQGVLRLQLQAAGAGRPRARFPLARQPRSCRSAARSACSTAAITRRCWWCACTPSC